MVYLDPNPIAITIGHVQIRWYGLIAAIGLLISYFMAPFIARKIYNDKDTEVYQNAVLLTAVSGIIGARMLHIILNWHFYMMYPIDMLKVWNGGLSFHGGLVLAAITLFIYSRYTKKSFLRIGDSVVIPVAMSLGLGRIGNIMNSEILGRPCYSCGFNFTFADNVPRYPLQLYSLAHHMLLAAITYYLLYRYKREGVGSASFLFFYSLFRSIVEFFRLEPIVIWHLDLAQLVSIPVIIFAGYWLYSLTLKQDLKKRRERNKGAGKSQRDKGIEEIQEELSEQDKGLSEQEGNKNIVPGE